MVSRAMLVVLCSFASSSAPLSVGDLAPALVVISVHGGSVPRKNGSALYTAIDH